MLSRSEVERLEDRRITTMISGNLHEFEALLSEGLLWTHASGRVDTKAEIIAQYAAGTMKCFRYDRSDVTINLFGEVAIVRGLVEMDAQVGETRKIVNSRYMGVWQQVETATTLIGWISARAG